MERPRRSVHDGASTTERPRHVERAREVHDTCRKIACQFPRSKQPKGDDFRSNGRRHRIRRVRISLETSFPHGDSMVIHVVMGFFSIEIDFFNAVLN